jgi:hypothetical protein
MVNTTISRLFERNLSVQQVALFIQNSESPSGWGGQSVTEFTCTVCSDVKLWGNTCVPKYCYKCALAVAKEFYELWLKEKEGEKEGVEKGVI